MSKKKGAKARFSPTDKECIYQVYVVTGTKSETARRCGVSVGSVHNVIKELEGRNADKPQLPTTKAARAEAAAKLAGRVHIKADMVLDSITPEDLESGRIPITKMVIDAETGESHEEVVGYRYYGPSAVAKATTFGILKDKETQSYKLEQEMLQDTKTGQLMLPDDLGEMVNVAERMIKEITVLNVRFKEDNPDLLTSMTEVLAEAVVVEETRPEVKSIDEFDNPE